MIITLSVSADTASAARDAAESLAYAQGYRSVSATFTTQTGPRSYDVQLTVSR